MPTAAQPPTRWAILGTATIAQTTFLPCLHAVGGVAELVAGRDADRAAKYADANGVRRSVAGYERALADDAIDAVYIPLPNRMHAEWTIAGLQAGKAVLCEKPLAWTAEETAQVLDVARETGQPLWEAIMFPFHRQTQRWQELLADGAIGEVREVHAAFHAPLADRADIRYSPELGAGALADVGCYPVRLGRMVLGDEAVGVRAAQVRTEDGVDVETWGTVEFPQRRRLLFSCSFTQSYNTMARILGTEGELRVSMPYAALPVDTVELHADDGTVTVEHHGTEEKPFLDILRHIHAVLAGEEEPRHLAVNDAYGSAAILDAVRRSAESTPEPVATRR